MAADKHWIINNQGHPGEKKKDNKDLYAAFDIESLLGNDFMDDKVAKNILGDLKKHMPPGGFPKHKPLLVPTA